MPLSPEEIERRTFPIAESGYQCEAVRDFLWEVAAGWCLMRHDTNPPVLPIVSATPSHAEAAEHHDWARRVLRAAQEQALSIVSEADNEARVLLRDAHLQAMELRRELTGDATIASTTGLVINLTAPDTHLVRRAIDKAVGGAGGSGAGDLVVGDPLARSTRPSLPLATSGGA
jgi:hypothetical protein